jgi:hypothetical protein
MVRYQYSKINGIITDLFFLKWWFICELLYIFCTCILKLSVGFFLLRVAINPVHIWILRVLMVGTVAFGTTYLFMVSFQCVPIRSYWDISPRAKGKCWNDQIVLGLTYVASIINCAADWVIGILPIFIVWSLRMPPKTKILVACILGFAAMYVPGHLSLLSKLTSFQRQFCNHRTLSVHSYVTGRE